MAALTEREKSSPAYQEALKLMNEKKIEKISTWESGKLKTIKAFQSRLSQNDYNGYVTAVQQYANELRTAYTRYHQNVGNSVLQEQELRRLLFSTSGRRMRTIDVSLQASTRNNVTPSTTTQSATTSQKSGFWKGVGTTALVVGLSIAGWFGGKALWKKLRPESEYKPPQTKTLVIQKTSLKTTVQNGSKVGENTISSGISNFANQQFNFSDPDRNLDQDIVKTRKAAIIADNVESTAKSAAGTAAAVRETKDHEARQKLNDPIRRGEDAARGVNRILREGKEAAEEANGLYRAVRHVFHK